MTVIKVDISGGVARLIVFGPLVRGEGAMGAIQRVIHRCSITKFCTLVVNLHGVEAIDQDGVDALTVAYQQLARLERTFTWKTCCATSHLNWQKARLKCFFCDLSHRFDGLVRTFLFGVSGVRSWATPNS